MTSSREYEKRMNEHANKQIKAAGIDLKDVDMTCLSADRTYYDVTLVDKTVHKVPSGFPKFED